MWIAAGDPGCGSPRRPKTKTNPLEGHALRKTNLEMRYCRSERGAIDAGAPAPSRRHFRN
ncbi:hypothetical protein JB92DRAFT_2947483 [Gautieria morchelliformis]|nr:hypothetical protein JB92DRAFT_2947483 [Gautieria morchelliformis]